MIIDRHVRSYGNETHASQWISCANLFSYVGNHFRAVIPSPGPGTWALYSYDQFNDACSISAAYTTAYSGKLVINTSRIAKGL